MTIEEYCEEEFQSAREISETFRTQLPFNNSCVLDVGCGFGGQTAYFALQGKQTAVGLDICKRYLDVCVDYAEQKEARGNVEFIRGDAANLPVRDDMFDILILSSVLEHLPQVVKSLRECKRTLKHGGRLFAAFPSWRYPYAAHLWNYIPIPWCHLLFSDQTLLDAMETMESSPSLISEKTHEIEQFRNLSRLTVGQFKDIVKKLGFKTIFYQEGFKPKFLCVFPLFPLIKEFFVYKIVCILAK